MKKLAILGLFLALSIPYLIYAQQTEQSIQLTVEIPRVEELVVGISRVDVTVDPNTGQISETWNPGQTEINFGKLKFDANTGVWRATCYYVVDIGVNTNAPNWSLQHQVTPLTDKKGHFLDTKVNVKFVKMVQQNGNDVEAGELGYWSYGMSNATFTPGQLQGGWLRIYYGIATGSGDATGVTPITMETPAGTYSGTITLTLTAV